MILSCVNKIWKDGIDREKRINRRNTFVKLFLHVDQPKREEFIKEVRKTKNNFLLARLEEINVLVREHKMEAKAVNVFKSPQIQEFFYFNDNLSLKNPKRDSLPGDALYHISSFLYHLPKDNPHDDLSGILLFNQRREGLIIALKKIKKSGISWFKSKAQTLAEKYATFSTSENLLTVLKKDCGELSSSEDDNNIRAVLERYIARFEDNPANKTQKTAMAKPETKGLTK